MSETHRTGQDGAQQAAGATIGRVDGPSIVQTAERLKAAAAGATPGPWRVGMPTSRCQLPHFPHGKGQCRYTFDGWFDDPSSISRGVEYGPDDEVSNECVAGRWDYEEGGILRKADAAYIATADPTTVTALADGVLALAGENERLRALVVATHKASPKYLQAQLDEARAQLDAIAEDGTEEHNAATILRQKLAEARAEVERLNGDVYALHTGLGQMGRERDDARSAAAHWQAEHRRVVEALVAVRTDYAGDPCWCSPLDNLAQSSHSAVCLTAQRLLTTTPTEAEPHTPAPADREER